MVVAISGMHRSGTSLTARLLHLAGLDLGSESEMVPASIQNPSGFWENRPFLDISDRLLAQFGGSWYAPVPLASDWVEAARQTPLWAEACRSVTQQFHGRGDWGWKDPRLSLTLPFWCAVLSEPGTLEEPPALRSVVCVRNPLDVASSQQVACQRGGMLMPTNQGLALWRLYTESALRNTRADDRQMVFL